MDKKYKVAEDAPADVTKSTQKTKRKGKNKAVLLLVILIVLAFVAVGTYFLYVMLTAKSSSETNNRANQTSFQSAEHIVNQVRQVMEGQQANVDIATGLGGVTNEGYSLYGVVPHQVNDRDFENLPGESVGFAFKGTSTEAAANYDAIVDFFDENNINSSSKGRDTSGTISEQDEVVNYVSYAVYETAGQLCMVWHVDATQTPLKSHLASLGCADKSSYNDAAKGLDAFFTAYKASVSEVPEDLVLGSPVVGDGSDGYEHAIVHQESGEQFEGLYYREKGSDSWTYLLGTRGEASCEEFVSDAAQKAFRDFECVDDSGDIKTVPVS